MPKLEIYNRQAQTQLQQTSPDALAQSITPLAQNGQTMADAGSQNADLNARVQSGLTNLGNEYVQKANAALEDGAFNSTWAKASISYNQAVQQRMQQSTDADGNPNFSSMQDDIGKIGDDTFNQFSKGIYNPNVAARFSQSFDQLRTSKAIQAGGVARQQESQFSIAALNEGLNADMVNATMDSPAMTGQYYQQSLDKIQSALKNGYLDPGQAAEQTERVRKLMYNNVLEVQNSTDPQALKARLDSGEDLGITPVERIQVQKRNEMALNDLYQKQAAQQAQKDKLVKDVQNYNNGEIELGLNRGEVGDLDVQSAFDKGKISHDQYVNLTQKLQTARGETLAKTQVRSNISSAISSGTDMSSFSTGDINDYYNSSLGSLKQNGQAPDISVKAQVAGNLKAPVTDFTNEIKGIITTGDNNAVVKAVQAYEYTASKSPGAVSKMDEKTQAFIASVGSQIRYTGADPAQAVIQARKAILEADDNVVKMRNAQFNSVKDFKNDTVKDTITGMYDTKFFGSDAVDDDLVPVVQNLLKNAYSYTGDPEAAKRMVVQQTNGIIGKTSLNSKDGNNVVMYAPPEKAYPQFNTADLRADLNSSLTSADKSFLPAGVNADQVQIQSDARTVNETNRPTYSLYYRDANGAQTPLLDKETGQPIRWAPDVQAQQRKLIEAQNESRNSAFGSQQDWAKRVEAAGARGYLQSAGINVAPIYDHVPVDTQASVSEMNPSIVNGEAAQVPTDGSKAPAQQRLVDRLPSPQDFLQQVPVSNQDSQLKGLLGSIAGVESGGNYQAIGPSVNSGDNALGKYQIMRSNLASWSQEALGRPVSQQEFLNSPELQDRVAQFKMDQYLTKYGNMADAASVWHSGRPYAQAAREGAVDQGTGLSTVNYVKRVMEASRNRNMDPSAPTGDEPNHLSISGESLNKSGLIAVPQQANVLTNSISDEVKNFTNNNLAVGYKFGSKDLKSGGVDCSGFVAQNTLNAMQNINATKGNVYNLSAMKDIMNQGAAWQIKSLGDACGYVPRDQIYDGSVPAGTLIGVTHDNPPSWAKGRPLGISHVVQVYDNNGVKFVSQSAGSTGGVSQMPLTEFLDKNKDTRLYATNPFNLVNSSSVSGT